VPDQWCWPGPFIVSGQGATARASMAFDVFATCGPARSVTRVTHRRPIERPRAAAVGRLLPTSDQIPPPGNQYPDLRVLQVRPARMNHHHRPTLPPNRDFAPRLKYNRI
jgi:hypothetical protein